MVCSAPMTETEEAIDFMPSVKARSPLKRNKAPATPWLSQMPLKRQAAWTNFAEGMIGAWIGSIPCLALSLRGRRKEALAQAGLLFAGAAALAALWNDSVQWVAWFVIFGAWMSGMMAESHIRMNAAEPARTIASFGFSLTSFIFLRSAIVGIFFLHYPAIDLQGVRGHADGMYFVEQIPVADYKTGDLVAFHLLQNHDYNAGGPIAIAPIIARPGQTIQNLGQKIYVEDADTPEVGTAQNPTGTYQAQQLTVPTDAVALFELPLRTRKPAEFLGRVVYQWSPAEERGPIEWPPSTTE